MRLSGRKNELMVGVYMWMADAGSRVRPRLKIKDKDVAPRGREHKVCHDSQVRGRTTGDIDMLISAAASPGSATSFVGTPFVYTDDDQAVTARNMSLSMKIEKRPQRHGQGCVMQCRARYPRACFL